MTQAPYFCTLLFFFFLLSLLLWSQAGWKQKQMQYTPVCIDIYHCLEGERGLQRRQFWWAKYLLFSFNFCLHFLVCLLRQQVKKHVVVHVVQRVHVDAQRVGHATHVKSERLEKLDKIHFLTWNKQFQIIRWSRIDWHLMNIPVNGLCSFGQTLLHWGHVHRSTSRCWQNSGAAAGTGSTLAAASLLGRVVVSSLGWFLSARL